MFLRAGAVTTGVALIASALVAVPLSTSGSRAADAVSGLNFASRAPFEPIGESALKRFEVGKEFNWLAVEDARKQLAAEKCRTPAVQKLKEAISLGATSKLSYEAYKVGNTIQEADLQKVLGAHGIHKPAHQTAVVARILRFLRSPGFRAATAVTAVTTGALAVRSFLFEENTDDETLKKRQNELFNQELRPQAAKVPFRNYDERHCWEDTVELREPLSARPPKEDRDRVIDAAGVNGPSAIVGAPRGSATGATGALGVQGSTGASGVVTPSRVIGARGNFKGWAIGEWRPPNAPRTVTRP
jgi:hypothetical protein